MTRKPIEFRQLCALVRSTLASEPTIDDAEWKARTLDTMAKWGFEEPSMDTLASAMTRVERAMVETGMARPLPVATTRPSPELPPPMSSARTRRPLGWELVQQVIGTLRMESGASGPSSAPPKPLEVLAISEPLALNEFWSLASRSPNRIAVLRVFAELAIVRDAGWDPAEIRAAADQHSLHADRCFGCARGCKLAWHHVIQIQHGGSNYSRNRVALCEACHADVHPWLNTGRTRSGPGWSSFVDVLPSLPIEKIA